jgi:nucleoside triphosphate pyrophosphatase
VRLVLASASPRRAALLRAAGFTFETFPVDVDETVRPGEAAYAYVRRLAMEKSARALAIVDHLPRTAGPYVRDDVEREPRGDVVIIGADTAVVVHGEILGKPRDTADAERMLRRLSGRRHEVMTGVSVRSANVERGGVETTAVECLALADADVSWYVASGEGNDKAGAYAIQGLASRFMARIEGSYSNVVGLPVHTVHKLLRDLR